METSLPIKEAAFQSADTVVDFWRRIFQGASVQGKIPFCQETSGTDLSASGHTKYFSFYQSNRELADPDIYTITIRAGTGEVIGIYTCHETDAGSDITMVQPEDPVRPLPSGRSAGSWYYPKTWCSSLWILYACRPSGHRTTHHSMPTGGTSMNDTLIIPGSGAEYRAKLEDYLRPRAYRGWHLVERKRRGKLGLAEKAYFDTRAQAEARRDELRQDAPARDLSVVECCVAIGISEPRNRRFRFAYSPDGAEWKPAQSQFEQFWRTDTRQQCERILWYWGEFTSLMGAGGDALDAAETKTLGDLNVIPVVRDGEVEIHPAGLIRQILHASKAKVQAHLFHQAVEVGMKGLLAADRWKPEDIRALGHNIGDVWEKVTECRRLEVVDIYDREWRGRPPASSAFDALVAEYGRGERGVTESLRYLGPVHTMG